MKTVRLLPYRAATAVKGTAPRLALQRLFAVLVLGAVLLALAQAARAASVDELVGRKVANLRGEPAGVVEDLLIDVRAGRVLYVIVDTQRRFYTLPIRALSPELRIDMSGAGDIANREAERLAHFQRAERLLGQPLEHPTPGAPDRIGVVRDIHFDPVSGEVERVVVATPQGLRDFPAAVLRQGRFPPLSGGKQDYVDREALGERGWVRGHASDERTRTHDYQWPQFPQR